MTAFTHSSLSRLLSRAGAEARASECHGFLCGQLCAAGSTDEDLWMEFLDLQSRDDELVEHCHGEIRGLLLDLDQELQSPDLAFSPLLPDDDRALAERVAALGDWCSGFLNGFGLVSGLQEAEIAQDCRELLEDLGAISRVGADEPDDGDEEHLMQVVEYVRVGVLTLYVESRRNADEHGAAGVLH